MTTTPLAIIAGDAARWTDAPGWAGGQFISAPDWALRYEIRGIDAATVTSTQDGTGWASVLSSAASKNLTPGVYNWYRVASKGSDTVTMASGRITVKANPMDVDGAQISVARQALQDCERAMAAFKSNGAVRKYTIGNRETEFHSLADLIKLRDFWALKVANEDAADAVATGRANPRVIHARLR
jgi:hypothetical protein